MMRNDLPTSISALYEKIEEAWSEHCQSLFDGACGYSIFGSAPVLRPKLMVLGENPGFGKYDRGGPPHIQKEPPTESYFEGESWPLKDRLLALFQQAGLEHDARRAVFANFLFFKSGSLSNEGDPLSWHKVDRRARIKLENLCEEQLRDIVTLIDPQTIIVLGMRAFDRHAAHHDEVTKASDEKRRLICKGTLWGKPAVALMHPTGARWSEADRVTAAQKLRDYIG